MVPQRKLINQGVAKLTAAGKGSAFGDPRSRILTSPSDATLTSNEYVGDLTAPMPPARAASVASIAGAALNGLEIRAAAPSATDETAAIATPTCLQRRARSDGCSAVH
jgi:hypothetical protein